MPERAGPPRTAPDHYIYRIETYSWMIHPRAALLSIHGQFPH